MTTSFKQNYKKTMYLFINRKEIDNFLYNYNYKSCGNIRKATFYYNEKYKVATILNENSISYINLENKKTCSLHGSSFIFKYLRSNIFYTVEWKVYNSKLNVGKLFFNGKEKDMYLIDCPIYIYDQINYINHIGSSTVSILYYLFKL